MGALCRFECALRHKKIGWDQTRRVAVLRGRKLASCVRDFERWMRGCAADGENNEWTDRD